MIPRYTTPLMAETWSEVNKFNTWLRIEQLAAEIQAQHGWIPHEAAVAIGARVELTQPDIDRIHDIEENVTRHDVVAFLRVVGEQLGDAAKYVHKGLGSSDVVDTATAVVCTQAMDALLSETDACIAELARLTDTHRNTIMVGRTHGVHAEPTTFGLKTAVWLQEMRRNRVRLERAREGIAVGKISGEVGNYAHFPPWGEAHICDKLGLAVAEASSQVLQRDRHAEVLAAIAITGGTLEKIATEIRSLQRTEILELEEPFRKKQTGSSAMPHKRNPIICERITGLARQLRAQAQTGFENQALWGERDISHSSVERVSLPGSTTLLHYMLVKMNAVLAGLNVYPERMRANMEASGGLVYSHQVLLKLIEAGLTRLEAYDIVQRTALEVWQRPSPRAANAFYGRLWEEVRVREVVDEQVLASCFDDAHYLEHIEAVMARVL